MQAVVTVNQMRSIDKLAIDGDVEKGYALMQKAGKALEEAAYKMLRNQQGTVWVFCGSGNNGGDGFVLARLLKENGWPVWCFAMSSPQRLQGEASKAYLDYISKGVDPIIFRNLEQLEGKPFPALVVDAMFGTGLTRPPEDHYAAVINHINTLDVPVLAVDTPSGLNHYEGKVESSCIHASRTIEMGFPKLTSFFSPAIDVCGIRETADLGYDATVVRDSGVRFWEPDLKFLRKLVPRRKSWGNKRDHGVCAVMAGSKGMSGAAVLASKASLRSGCGLSFLAHPKSLSSILSTHLTESVLKEMPETSHGSLSEDAEDSFLELLKQVDSVVIGPGLSTSAETQSLVQKLVQEVEKPLLLDADGLNAFVGKVELLKNRKEPLILTPHRREWERLFGELPSESEKLVDAVRLKAEEIGATLVLKGRPTIVALPSGFVFLLSVGNSGLATAGTGDVLSGMIVSFMAQGCTPGDAALLSVWLHGKAGDLVANDLTEYGLVASDLLNRIPVAIKTLLESSPRI